MTARIAAIAAIVAAAAAAHAEPIDLGPATLGLDDGWAGAAPTPDGVTRTRGAVTVVVRRWEVPNLPAWRSATRDAHVDAIARGFAAAPGYVELTRTVGRTGRGVPTLDLTFHRRGPAGDEVVAARVLLFRTLTMVAIAGGGERGAVERTATSLRPD